MLRQRLDSESLFNVFIKNGDYNSKDKKLIHELALFIPGVIQTKDCLKHKKLPQHPTEAQRLSDILCEFSYAYSPLPSIHGIEKSELVKGRRIGKRSVNGRLYQSEFEGNPVVIKTPIQWDTTSVRELFINFCINSETCTVSSVKLIYPETFNELKFSSYDE